MLGGYSWHKGPMKLVVPKSRIFIREAECCTRQNKVSKKGHVATSEPILCYAIVISIQCLGRIRSTRYKERAARALEQQFLIIRI
jgi:hypothetical protein